MTKEQQREAARRIMAKSPMTEEERETYEMLVKSPEDYRAPTDKRVCGICGAEFRDKLNAKGEVEIPMLEAFSDHQAEHNPTPDQWGTAHERIQAGKERAKGM